MTATTADDAAAAIRAGEQQLREVSRALNSSFVVRQPWWSNLFVAWLCWRNWLCGQVNVKRAAAFLMRHSLVCLR